MNEEDCRGYVYRFIKERGAWGFIALNGTSMGTEEVMIVPFERWSTTGEPVSYDFCAVLYSKSKVRRMIEEHGTHSPLKMSGTDVFQVLKRNVEYNTRQMACVVWVPDTLPGSLDITCYSPVKCNKLVEGDISFIDLRRLIRHGLSITVPDTTISSTEYSHIV